MRNRPVEFFIVDILICIDRIKRYTADFKTCDDFESSSEAVFDATMRELELLGEAVKYVLNAEKLKSLINPEWRVVVSFRNVVAHEYFGLDIGEIFNAIKNDLPEFESEFLLFFKKLRNDAVLVLAVDDAIQELKRLNRVDSIKYLEQSMKL